MEYEIIYKIISFLIAIYVTLCSIVQLVGVHGKIGLNRDVTFSSQHVYWMTITWTLFYFINIYFS
jgi:hypothetical protein